MTNLLYSVLLVEYVGIALYHLFQKEYAKAFYWISAFMITLSVRLM